MIKIGVIGYGYWGPNVLRNFYSVHGAKVVACCDGNSKRLEKVREIYPDIKTVTDYKLITRDPSIDAVAVVTPVFTHFDIAKDAIENGKHVFLEKPMTSTSAQANELVALAKKANKIIMVDHTFLFTGAVKKIKEILDKGELGDLYFFDSVRINLGLFQHDINVVWDLAPHDLSVMNFLISKKPVSVCAIGAAHINKKVEDTAYLTINFEDNLIAHFHLNWLSPVKIRKTLISGSKKMLVWDDLSADEKIKIYHKGVDAETREGEYNLRMKYRSGDIWSPEVEGAEALKSEVAYFLDCISRNQVPFNDGQAGADVVRILEASDESIKNGGRRVEL